MTRLNALQRLNTARPFRPFTIELVNRVRIISRHPEAIALRGDLAIFVDIDRTVEMFDAASVARLVSKIVPHGAE